MRPPHGHTDTSIDAADSMEEIAGRLRRLVYASIFHSKRGGMTCDELEEALNMRHQTASARLWELHHTQDIRDSGARRRTRSGRAAIVWIITREDVLEAAQ